MINLLNSYYYLDPNASTLQEDSNSFVDSIVDFFSNFTSTLRSIYESLKGGITFLNNINNQMDSLISHNSIEGINLNTYVGTIRYVVGDLIFYEMYVVLMLLVILEMYFIFTKIWQGFSYLISKLSGTSLVKLFEGSAIFKWLFSKFGL